MSGTVTVNVRALESNAMANYGVLAAIWQIASGNGAATFIGFLENTTELGTVETARSIAITPTSTALADQDMLALVISYFSAGGTSASGFTASGFYAGTSSGASGDTFVTFTETITTFSGAPFIEAPSLAAIQAVNRSSVY